MTSVLIEAFTPEQSSRYDMFKRTKLNKATLRRIVNQTLSQSVPPAVVTTVSGFTKVFIGEIIEKARTVQSEWAGADDNAVIEALEKAEGEAAERAAKRAAEEAGHERDRTKNVAAAENAENGTTTTEASQDGDGVVKVERSEGEEDKTVKSEQSPHEQNIQSITPHTSQIRQEQQEEQQPKQPPLSSQLTVPDTMSKDSAQSPLKLPANVHRGPLLPSHLREALRRSKRATEGGNVGFSGFSMNSYGVKGSLTWSVRGGGGRRLFR